MSRDEFVGLDADGARLAAHYRPGQLSDDRQGKRGPDRASRVYGGDVRPGRALDAGEGAQVSGDDRDSGRAEHAHDRLQEQVVQADRREAAERDRLAGGLADAQLWPDGGEVVTVLVPGGREPFARRPEQRADLDALSEVLVLLLWRERRAEHPVRGQ